MAVYQLQYTYKGGQKCENGFVSFYRLHFGKPNFVLLVQVKKCTFSEHQS